MSSFERLSVIDIAADVRAGRSAADVARRSLERIAAYEAVQPQVWIERVAEAEVVYREDLGLGGALPRAQIHPDNVWALRGLLDCLERRGETVEAGLIRQRVDFAAARADQPVAVSCFCARGRAA